MSTPNIFNDIIIDPSKTSDMWIGTDLGTSNSCVSVYQQSTQTLLIPTPNGSVLLPSLVHFAANGDVLVGEGAKIAGIKSPERTIFSAKRMLGRKFNDPVIQNGLPTWPFKVIEGNDGFPLIELEICNEIVYKSAIDVQMEILKYIRTQLAQQVLHWDNCVNIVITVPAYFNHNQRHCTIQAAYKAGFKQVHIINEPSAAAFYFGYKESVIADRLVNNILVFDLGGGTLDVSLIDVHDNIYKVLSTDGDTNFGGFDIDKFIVDWLIQQIKNQYQFDIYDAHIHEHLASNLAKLSTIAEKLKKSLSSLLSVTESSISLRGVPEGNKGYEDGFEITIDRNVLNKYFIGQKHGRLSTLRAIQRCVKKANLTLRDVHKVILVGGSTRIPAISKMITQFFQSDTIIAKTVNADEAVTLGACLHAATLSTTTLQQLKQPIELYDIAPLSYSIHISSSPSSTVPIQPRSIQFIPRNSCLIRDQDLIHTEVISLGSTTESTEIELKLIETDEAVDITEALAQMNDNSYNLTDENLPTSPGSPVSSENVQFNETPYDILHTTTIIQPPVALQEQLFKITLRLTSDYNIYLSIVNMATKQEINELLITPFERYSSLTITSPTQQSNEISQTTTTTQSPPPPTTTTTQTPPTTTTTQSSASTTSQDGLIKGKVAAYWDKSNWIEICDSDGMYYKNKVTGDTTFYEDDFDIDNA